MKKTKWLRREIIKRFMDNEELDIFDQRYEQAKLVNVGRSSIKKEELPF